jgi:uncharacterized protein with HEPN domain
MSRRETAVRLRHMLDHAKEAIDIARGKTRSDLDQERLLNLALVRLLEIIGEAAARVPQDDRELYPEIPWPEIVGLRNRLIHGYDEVDFDILWEIVAADLPVLIEKLEKILGTEKSA